MKKSILQIFTLALVAFMLPLHSFAQEKDSTKLKPGEKEWDNFRERDASIYYFTFCVPESYVTSVKAERDSKFLSSASWHINFDVARYEVFEILEEELNKKTQKKFVVADPEKEDKTFKSYCPGCMSDGKVGFEHLPGWAFRQFIKYDQEVPYLVQLTVNVDDKIRFTPDIGPTNLKPKCTIKIKIFDRDKNVVGKYKYVKKDFDKVRVKRSENKVYDKLLNSEWKVSATNGLELGDIMGIYVQTLQEMMRETDIILP